jgi:hypothetical protein
MRGCIYLTPIGVRHEIIFGKDKPIPIHFQQSTTPAFGVLLVKVFLLFPQFGQVSAFQVVESHNPNGGLHDQVAGLVQIQKWLILHLQV